MTILLNLFCINTTFIAFIFLCCRKTNINVPGKKEVEGSLRPEYRICENAFGRTMDSPCMPFIDDSHIDSTDDETPRALCCSTHKPPLERTISTKQQSNNDGSKSKLQMSQIMPQIFPNSIKDDDIDNPRIIESSSMSVKESICPSNKEYRANIEKYCLNLNPYTSKLNMYAYTRNH